MKSVERVIRVKIAGALVLISVCLLGCHDAEPTKDYQKRERLQAQLSALHSNYATAEVKQARQSLQSAVKLLETAQCLERKELAFGMLMEYARLMVLETRAGNETLADAYLLKARYWRLIELESSGDSTEEAMKKLESFTAEKCIEIVSQFDKPYTKN